MIQNIVNFYPKSKNIISSLLHVMKAEKRLDRFKYIFPRHLIGPLFHHYIMNLSGKAFNRVKELRVNFGTNFEKFHLLRHKSLTSAHVIFLHGAEVNIPIELGAEVNTGCRSPQVGAEVTSVPNIDCLLSIYECYQFRS